MNPWPRRLTYLLVVLAWLLLISIPFLSFSLAARTQLQLGAAEGSHIRLFLIQDTDSEGIGLEFVRPVSSNSGCTQSSVNYFMWKGDPENVAFCQCLDPDTGYALPAEQGTCRSN